MAAFLYFSPSGRDLEFLHSGVPPTSFRAEGEESQRCVHTDQCCAFRHEGGSAAEAILLLEGAPKIGPRRALGFLTPLGTTLDEGSLKIAQVEDCARMLGGTMALGAILGKTNEP